MADSEAEDLKPARVQQKTFLRSLPNEILLKFIFKHSSLVSLMQLSATCRYFRLLVHGVFTSRLSAQDANYPEVRESLVRLGWTKDHRLWNCNCFKIMGGPGVTWGYLEQQKSSSIACEFFRLPELSTTVAGKTFLFTKVEAIVYWENASDVAMGSNSPQTLITINKGYFHFLSSFDNVMAFGVTSTPHYLGIYNPTTLRKITDIDIGKALVEDITFAEDTMVVHLHDDEEACSVSYFQIWKINTKDPQEEGIELLSMVSYHNAPISKFVWYEPPMPTRINDRFIVILDTMTRTLNVLSRDKEPVLIRQLEISDGVMWEHSLKGFALEKKQGDLLAVAFKRYNGSDPELVIQVSSVSSGNLIIQKELGPCPGVRFMDNSPEVRYIEWFGPHLVVVTKHGNLISMMSWQNGLGSFVTSPLNAPVVRRSRRSNSRYANDWDFKCLKVDYGGIMCALYDKEHRDRENRLTYFQNWDSL